MAPLVGIRIVHSVSVRMRSVVLYVVVYIEIRVELAWEVSASYQEVYHGEKKRGMGKRAYP